MTALAPAVLILAAGCAASADATLRSDSEGVGTQLPAASDALGSVPPTAASTELPATPALPTAAPTIRPTPVPIGLPVPPVQLPGTLSATTIVDRLRVRSEPGTGGGSVIHQPVLPLGATFVIVDGPVAASGYWWYEVTNLSVALEGGVRTGWLASADRDGTAWIGPARDACERFPFFPGDITVATFGDLERGFVGRWSGCVTTPWARPYWVDVEFRVDGSYSAVAGPSVNDYRYPAFYYGMDEASPLKRFELDTLRDDLEGSGWIDIVFDVGSVNRDELRNIRLMGDDLEFEFFHGEYGPVVFRLYRIDS